MNNMESWCSPPCAFTVIQTKCKFCSCLVNVTKVAEVLNPQSQVERKYRGVRQCPQSRWQLKLKVYGHNGRCQKKGPGGNLNQGLPLHATCSFLWICECWNPITLLIRPRNDFNWINDSRSHWLIYYQLCWCAFQRVVKLYQYAIWQCTNFLFITYYMISAIM